MEINKNSFKINVYYDSWCPVCVKVTNRIKALDWLNLINMISLRDPAVAKELNVSSSELERRMHALIVNKNKTVSGIRAFSAMVIRIPLLLPIWPILIFLQIIKVGDKAYDYFATKRNIVPVGNCEDNACRIK